MDGEKMVGLFLNNLPLRQHLGGGTWADLVLRTFSEERQLVPHRRFPLAEIKKLTGGQSLFETAFDFVHFHVYQQLQGCRGLDLAEGHYFEANNLTTYTTFMLDVTSTRLELHIDYDPNELCLEQIERINCYYLNTLQAMAADPDACYESFSPLSESECKEMLLDWNLTRLDYPSASGLADLFEHQVKRRPEAIALVFGRESLTYRQLNDQAELLAHALRGLNLAPEELVGICLERSPQMVVGLLGILKAGGAYLPLDPTYPKERLAFMLEDSKVRLLLTQRPLIETIPSSTAQLLCADDLLSGCGAEAAVAPPANPSRSMVNKPHSDRLAYVIYTSGSTGKPKGVIVNQGSVINLLLSAARTAAITDRDNLLAVTTLSFDIAGLEIFMPLITGGRLTLASREQAGDGSQLATLMASARPTIMQATPATWRLLIEAGWTGDKDLAIFCGGEALKRELADELLFRGRDVWNFYGPTETTIWSTAWKVVPGEPITIGRPLGNTQVYILDSQLRPVPVGTAGELHIGGAGLARGYLRRDELTSEKFIPNPFAAASGERLYKTGDLARYLPDGAIECLGRLDHQVKIRGFRIELGEVETVLRQHIGIADAVVTARDDSLGEKRLVGYLISRNGPPSSVELREFARTKLPLYMVPAQFVTLQEFPLTPNGKIDLRRLPAPDSASNTGRTYVAPRNTQEQSLAAIWQEVLMLKQVGIDDDFFELGGDSLSATRAFARTNQAFGTSLTLREMLDHPTIHGLSELVARSKGTAPVRPPILPRSARPPKPAPM
jgi:amino acid adenylation domain-containing protein